MAYVFTRRAVEALYGILLTILLASLLNAGLTLGLLEVMGWAVHPLHISRQVALVVIAAGTLLCFACYALAIVFGFWRVRRIADAPLYGVLAIPGVNIWAWRQIKARRNR